LRSGRRMGPAIGAVAVPLCSEPLGGLEAAEISGDLDTEISDPSGYQRIGPTSPRGRSDAGQMADPRQTWTRRRNGVRSFRRRPQCRRTTRHLARVPGADRAVLRRAFHERRFPRLPIRVTANHGAGTKFGHLPASSRVPRRVASANSSSSGSVQSFEKAVLRGPSRASRKPRQPSEVRGALRLPPNSAALAACSPLGGTQDRRLGP
jgi:hypothetical protein